MYSVHVNLSLSLSGQGNTRLFIVKRNWFQSVKFYFTFNTKLNKSDIQETLIHLRLLFNTKNTWTIIRAGLIWQLGSVISEKFPRILHCQRVNDL